MKQLFVLITLSLLVFSGCAASTERQQDDRRSNATEAIVSSIDKAQFLKKVWNYNDSPDEWKFLGNKPVIIDFYADWCGPCKVAGPILEEVAESYKGNILVYKIDTQTERELAGVFGIKSIPTFLYIPVEGKPMMTAGIGRSKNQTRQMFIDNIKTYLLKQTTGVP